MQAGPLRMVGAKRSPAVVGAGPAGLAAAAALRRAGLTPTVLEKTDEVASSWRRRYDRLRLNTSRWNSKLPGSRYPRGTPIFPRRDDVVAYLEDYAAHNQVDIRFGTPVERIDRDGGSGWILRTPKGDVHASHVIVSTGQDHTPDIPDWPGRDRFQRKLLHAAEYRNPEPFRDNDVLVAGPGCSGVEIAYDLAENGAASVRLAVRTPPNVVLRSLGGVPNDLPALVALKLPAGIVDSQLKLVRKLAVGRLDEFGLPVPEVGVMTRLKREGKAPAIVDRVMIDAIKDRRIVVVAGVQSFDETGVTLVDGTRIEPHAVIAATGYRRGLEPLVGHLDVLDERGWPRVHRGREATPGLWFTGYQARPGQIRLMGIEARRAARVIARDLRHTDNAALG